MDLADCWEYGYLQTLMQVFGMHWCNIAILIMCRGLWYMRVIILQQLGLLLYISCNWQYLNKNYC